MSESTLSRATDSAPVHGPAEAVDGVDVEGMKRFRAAVARDPAEAQREPAVTAVWLGGGASRAQVGDIALGLGGDGEPNAMQALLCSLAACDVDVVALHAALAGIRLEKLAVEAGGHFDVRAYLGLDDAPEPGYDRISYRVRLRAPGATREQLAYLRERCERSSPVGSSLARAVPLTLDVEPA